jgi:hypothetical protein
MADAQGSRMDELERSLGNLQTEMREQIARTRVNTRVTLIVGLVVVAIIIGYLSWLMGEVKKFAEPRGIADDVLHYAEKNAPDMAARLEAKLETDVQDNVKYLEELALQQMPNAREFAVAQGKKYLEENAPALRDQAIAAAKTYLKENAQKLREQIAGMAKQYTMTLVDQLPDLRTKAWGTIHQAMDQLPQLRKEYEEKALAQMDQLTATLDQKADEIVDEMLKNADTLKPLVAAAGTPEGAQKLTDEMTKNMETIVGTQMDQAFAEFDRSLTPYEQYLDELQVETLTPQQKLHKEMLTSMLLMLDDALALGQVTLGTPVPAPVVNP